MKVEHIVAATDFSRPADAAVHRAALLAGMGGARLDVLHAINLSPLVGAWRSLIEGEGVSEARLNAAATARMARFTEELAQRTDITPQTHILSGKPAQAVADWARDAAADLVVIGAHGEHLLLDLLVGSTALKLLRLVSQPVLLVKQTPLFPYERVLVATDFSPAARAAANLAASLLEDVELYLLHVYEVPFERELYYAGSDDDAVEHYRRLGQNEARRQMDEFIQTLDEPTRFIGRIRHGYPSALVNQYASEIKADLLVLGANRQSELMATLFGSVATHLVNESHADLLLVPSQN
ncbi:MAG: universal stress protein [Sterolibacterium sp.]|nr:universal stress protein [Sterolibacterium sp.]